MHRNFLDLYDRYFDDVYRYIYFKTGNKWDADDLAGDVFRKAFEKFASVNTNPKAWLFTIARNTLTDFYRIRGKNILNEEDIDSYAYPVDSETELYKKEELGFLREALSRLTKEELEIINLRYFSDMKYNEIGILLGKSEDSVKMKAGRIIKKLKSILEQYMEG